jgi:hypothetical protein
VGHEDAARQLGELAGHADEDDVAQAVVDGLPQRRAREVADLDEADLGQVGQHPHRGLLVRPPVASTSVGSPWAAITETACTTEARHDSVENGRTTPVVPRMLMPPRMPRRAFVVLRARSSPSGTLIVTVDPRTARSTTAPTLSRIICRGTGLIAGPPTSSPSPGLVTTPDARRQPSRWTAGRVRPADGGGQVAPWVTSGSSPASLTTTGLARDGADLAAARPGTGTDPRVGQDDLDRRLLRLGEQARSWPPGRRALHVPVVQPRAQRARCGPSPCAAGPARAARDRSRST